MPEIFLFCVHTTGHFEANNDFVGGQELSTFVLLISSLLASIIKQLECKGAIYGEVQYFLARQQLVKLSLCKVYN